MEGDEILVSINVGLHTPTVLDISIDGENGNVISGSKKITLNWNGTDFDVNKLIYSVLYSNDNSKTCVEGKIKFTVTRTTKYCKQ